MVSRQHNPNTLPRNTCRIWFRSLILSNIPKLIKSIFASTQLIKLIDRLILLSHCSTMHVVLQFPWSEQLTAATRSSRQRRIPNDAAARDMFVGRIKRKGWSMVDLQVPPPLSLLFLCWLLCYYVWLQDIPKLPNHPSDIVIVTNNPFHSIALLPSLYLVFFFFFYLFRWMHDEWCMLH